MTPTFPKLGVSGHAGAVHPFVRVFAGGADWDWLGWLLAFVVSTVLLAFLSIWAISTNRVRELSLGPAKLALGDAATTYFDAYLDELVYFFQRTKTRVVIFEDLERFDDSGIFLALRDLNGLVNSAPDIGDVAFVYAIRDSLFEGNKITSSPDAHARFGVESGASDRAKFFDLVVPLAPFISHEVSSDLLLGELSDLPDVSRPSAPLIRLAGRYFTDMRVLRSIRYEYGVFLDEILRKTTVKGLTPDGLLAMVLYKHQSLTDFERIRTGGSRLDSLLTELSRLTAGRLGALDKEIAEKDNRIEAAEALSDRKAAAAERLREALGRIARTVFGSPIQVAQVTILGQARAYTSEQLDSSDFWQGLVALPKADLQVAYQTGNAVTIKSVDRGWLLRADSQISKWLVQVEAAEVEDRERLVRLREDLRGATVAQRISSVRFDGTLLDSDEAASFSETAERVLGAGLLLDLVRRGYVDHNFSLYSTTYYGAFISATARSYILQVVDRHGYDPMYALDASKDADAVAELAGADLWGSASALNLAIVDHFIDDPHLDETLDLIASETVPEAGSFVESYLSGGQHPHGLVARLAGRWNRTPDLIAASQRISEETRKSLLGTVMSALAPELEYDLADATRTILRPELGVLPAMQGGLPPAKVEALAKTLRDNLLLVEDLTPVDPEVRDALVAHRAFVISRRNLGVIVGDLVQVGLDSVFDASPEATEYMLQQFPEYLDALNESDPPAMSIDDSDRLLEVLSYTGLETDDLDALLLRATPTATLADLSQALLRALPSLARSRRFSPTLGNVVWYFETVGSLDEALSGYLSVHPSLAPSKGVSNGQVLPFAEEVVNGAHLTIPTKIAVLKSLDVETPLRVSNLKLTDGALFAYLLDASLVPDAAATFNEMAGARWPVKESGISASKGFAGYLGAVTFTDAEIENLLESPRVRAGVKNAMLQDLDSYAPRMTSYAATCMAHHAVAERARLSLHYIELLRDRGAESEPLAALIGLSVSLIDDAALVATLMSLGGDYAKLTTATGSRVTLTNTPGLQEILNRLKLLGYVSSSGVAESGFLRVNMKRSSA